MVLAVADTHAVIWYLFQDSRLSPKACSLFEEAATRGEQIAFSAITLAEIVYLAERGRIKKEVFQRLIKAIEKDQSMLVEIPFNRHVAEVMARIARTEVPDLPDRIIAATAAYLSVPVISRDRTIRASSVETIW